MDFFDIAHGEACANNITVCSGCDSYGSHARGWAEKETRTIHIKAALTTRGSLYRFLHEVGHIVNDETGMKRWEREQAANRYAEDSMRTFGIHVPRKVQQSGARYVQRFYRFGKRVAEGRRNAAIARGEA